MILKFLLCLQPSIGTTATCIVTTSFLSKRWKCPFKGQYKDCDDIAKVGTILNWLGDNVHEVYENLHWGDATHKDNPDHIPKAFEKYFKPEQNQFHSWYTLGSIYSGQFKCQHNFLNRIKEVARDCSFMNVDEIIWFLFLTHNQDTKVREELLKMMKTTDSHQDALQIVHLAEGTMHLEELSKQYLDTVKKDAQVDSLNQGKGNQFRSQGHGCGCRCGKKQASNKHDTSGPKPGGSCGNCGTKHPPKHCPAFQTSCYYCKKEGHFSKFCCTRAHSQSQQCKKKDMNDLENESLIQNNFTHLILSKSPSIQSTLVRISSNRLFDETDGLEHVLTDLCIQEASNAKDYRPASNQYKGPVLKCRFKVDSGATGKLLPYNVFHELFPGMPDSVTKSSIDHRVCLVAYNKEEIKQYGCCMLKVNYSGKTMLLPFYTVNSKFKPIIGLDASSKFGLLTTNCSIHQSWTSSSPTNASFDAVSGETPVGNVPIYPHKRVDSRSYKIQTPI